MSLVFYILFSFLCLLPNSLLDEFSAYAKDRHSSICLDVVFL